MKPQNPITYTLNEAGEIEETEIPRTGSSPIRSENDYDAMGRLSAERDGVGNETDYTYNLAGDLLTVRDDRPVTVTSTYDRLGREIARSVTGTPGADEDADFEYDPAGHLKSASNAEGAVTVDYDDAGRIATVIGDSGATTYTYAGDFLTSVVDDSSTAATSFVHSEVTGRLASISDPVTGGTTSFTEYTDAGKLERRTDPAGVEHLYEYDQAGRRGTVTSSKDGDQIALFDQDYDPNGRVVSETQQVDGGLENGTWTYGYDDVGRLTTADAPDGITSFNYEYDLAGNRTLHKETTTIGGQSVERDTETSYDTAGRPEQSSLVVTTEGVSADAIMTTYGHDNAGNLTSRTIGSAGDTGWTYEYDGLSRLSGVTQKIAGLQNPVDQDLTYDPLGRNLTSSTDVEAPGGEIQVTETTNHYRGLDETLAETEQSTLLDDLITIDTDYASGPQGMIAQKTSTQVVGEPLVTDTKVLGMGPHSDVSYTTDLAGAVTSTQTYDPWGVVRTETGTTDTDLGYQSDPTDENTGLVDMGARHYLPELGRFLTQDPLRGEPTSPSSQNRYIYGLDDPASLWDPTGLCPNPKVCGPDPRTSKNHQQKQSEIAQQTIASDNQSPPVYVTPSGPPTAPYVHYVGDEDRNVTIHFTGIQFADSAFPWPLPDGISTSVNHSLVNLTPIRGTNGVFLVEAEIDYRRPVDANQFAEPSRGIWAEAQICGTLDCRYLMPGRHSSEGWGFANPNLHSEDYDGLDLTMFFHERVRYAEIGTPTSMEVLFHGELPQIMITKNDYLSIPISRAWGW